ncbi:MAG: hypothetical protein JSS51_04090 [Planctomycetes bacterium]|nr:hypothetical protein [Planctomycetota bacterium]
MLSNAPSPPESGTNASNNPNGSDMCRHHGEATQAQICALVREGSGAETGAQPCANPGKQAHDDAPIRPKGAQPCADEPKKAHNGAPIAPFPPHTPPYPAQNRKQQQQKPGSETAAAADFSADFQDRRYKQYLLKAVSLRPPFHKNEFDQYVKSRGLAYVIAQYQNLISRQKEGRPFSGRLWQDACKRDYIEIDNTSEAQKDEMQAEVRAEFDRREAAAKAMRDQSAIDEKRTIAEDRAAFQRVVDQLPEAVIAECLEALSNLGRPSLNGVLRTAKFKGERPSSIVTKPTVMGAAKDWLAAAGHFDPKPLKNPADSGDNASNAATA